MATGAWVDKLESPATNVPYARMVHSLAFQVVISTAI
jgi:hypothetical protein